MSMKENSAYIKGLMDGVELNKATPEGKVIAALCETIDKMSAVIDELTEKLETANAYIEEIDEDLGAVEDLIYSVCDDDDCDCCNDDDECDCCDCDDECDCCDDDDDDDGFRCVLCPHCGDTSYIEESVDPSDVVCPSCQKPLSDGKEDE